MVGIEFGEKILWRKKKANKMAKLRRRWAYGIFVGVRPKSGGLCVTDQSGDSEGKSGEEDTQRRQVERTLCRMGEAYAVEPIPRRPSRRRRHPRRKEDGGEKKSVEGRNG